jgi:hypothetical protein
MHANEARGVAEQARVTARARPTAATASLLSTLHATAGNGAVTALFVQRMYRAGVPAAATAAAFVLNAAAPAFVPGAHAPLPARSTAKTSARFTTEAGRASPS